MADPKIKSIYRASFNAKIAKTISLAHLGERAKKTFWDSLPKQFHSDQPLVVQSFLKKCSTAKKVSCDPDLALIKSYWDVRAKAQGVSLGGCSNYQEVAERLGIAKIKILATPGCMDKPRKSHFEAWLKDIYKELFPVKARAKRLSEKLYGVKHDFLSMNTPSCYHKLPSGDVRPYFEIRGWEFHGDVCSPPGDATVLEIEDFQHLNLSPVMEAYTKDPWDDVMEQLSWGRSSILGEAFFKAAHDDFHDWLNEKNAKAS